MISLCLFSSLFYFSQGKEKENKKKKNVVY